MNAVKGFLLVGFLISLAVVAFLNLKQKKELNKSVNARVLEKQIQSNEEASRAVENQVNQDLQQAQEERNQNIEE